MAGMIEDTMVCYTCGWKGKVSQTDYSSNIGRTCRECGQTVTIEDEGFQFQEVEVDTKRRAMTERTDEEWEVLGRHARFTALNKAATKSNIDRVLKRHGIVDMDGEVFTPDPPLPSNRHKALRDELRAIKGSLDRMMAVSVLVLLVVLSMLAREIALSIGG